MNNGRDCVITVIDDEATAKVLAKDKDNKFYPLSANDNKFWNIKEKEFQIIGIIRQTIH